MKVIESERFYPCYQVSWRYVKSAQNPADCANRGLSTADFKSMELWWHGPSWMNDENSWPLDLTLRDSAVRTVGIVQKVSHESNCINSFSDLLSLQRVAVLILRWKTILVPNFSLNRMISSVEISEAMKKLLKFDQYRSFHQELKGLATGKFVRKRSPLARLTIFFIEMEY